jgi:FAD:protein FMN transferase
MAAVPADAATAQSPPPAPDFEIAIREGGITAICFVAMGGPCELLLDTTDPTISRALAGLAAGEAARIEGKFSRYRPESIVSAINSSQGNAVVVDAETASLLDYAAQCHSLSDGLFDITSGVLRRCWKFDGSDRVPEPAAIAELLPLIGFDKVHWRARCIRLPAGMEIDLGGFGKEYAVDRVLGLITQRYAGAALVNFGGDLAANRAPSAGPWRVGVERPDAVREARLLLELSQGALATSGDTHRYVLRDGVRYSHILDVRTGWPIAGVPRSVTVAAHTCVQAGTLATFAMLQGNGAESFLEAHGVRFWCLR